MNLVDIGGILFVGLWLVFSCRYIFRQKKAGKCIGCSGCKSSDQCSSCHKYQ